MESRFVELDGLRLHAVEYGGDGPPLLAVHGTGLVAQVWGVLVPYLMPHFRVVALDRKGHGDSDKPSGGYEMENAAVEYAVVADALGLRGGVAIGHSSGGTSLALAAARYPDLFARLALLDPIIFPRRQSLLTHPAATMVERTRKRRSAWTTAQEMFDSLGGKPPFGTWQPVALWDYVRHGAETREDGSVSLKCPPDLEAQMYGHSTQLDLYAEIAKVPIPVLIVRGALSDRLPRANAEHAVQVMPNARLAEMPGLTHFPAMEDPEGVGKVIVPFLLGA